MDLYLKKNGLITLVMPKSVILGTQHTKHFQNFNNPKSKLLEIWDLQNISNLFGMPTCVLFGQKGLETIYPVKLLIFNQINKNKKKFNNEKLFQIVESTYSQPGFQESQSFYTLT